MDCFGERAKGFITHRYGRLKSLVKKIIRSTWASIAPNRHAVIGGYANGELWRRRMLLLVVIYGVALAAAGAAFAYFGTSVLLPFSGILAVLILLIVWALPESRNPPVRWIRRLLAGFLIALFFWPDYLAFDIPGLPWITALRIFGVPLALVFLICLSVSGEFRKALADRLSATPWVHRFLVCFFLLAVTGLVFSNYLDQSVNKIVVAAIYWVVIYYCCVWVFATDGRALKLAYVIWAFAVLTSLVGVQEWRMQQIPWAGHIPSFMAVDDPVIETILAAKVRASTGIYRLKSKFTTPLGFAEFLAFSTPFMIYFVIYSKRPLVKLLASASLGLVLWAIIKTDSRLGAAGFFMSILLFTAGWSITKWKLNRESIFAPALTIAYPVIAAMVFLATFVVGTLRNMVWGTKAQSFSSEAREVQIEMGLPMIFSQPWGHGIGTGGITLGYRNLAGTLTIDSYYLVLGLEFGVLGFLFYAGFLFASIYYGLRYLLNISDEKDLIIIPYLILIIVFIVEKAVFAQQENHPLVFASLGIISALCWRMDRKGQMGVPI